MDEGPSSDGGLSAKYQKLAFEYSKIRAQAQVLKKAVSDEQAKTSEFKDALKEKEQAIRKLEQEVESLNFRNQQLTKRVAFLQEELDGDRGRRNKKKHGATHSPISQGVIDAELQSRIEENEKLHLQVSSAELEHKQVVESLQLELEEAQRAVQLRETSLSETLHRQEADIDRLAQDRAKLELKLRNCEQDLKAALLSEETCRDELRSLRSGLGARLRDAVEALERATVFRDNADRNLNDLNVPVTTHRHGSRVRALLCTVAESIPEAVQALSTLHTYMEQRVRLLASQDCGVDSVQRGPLLVLAQHLHSNVSYLQPIEEAYQSYFDSMNRDKLYVLNGGPCTLELSNALSKYVCYLNKLLPYTVITLQTGLALLSPNSKIKDFRMKLCCTARGIVAKFTKLDRYLRLLSDGGIHSRGERPRGAGYVAIAGKMVGAVRSIWQDFDRAKKQLSVLMLAEHEMPTVSDEARTTDDCIFNSLVTVVSCFEKISKALDEHSKVILDDHPYYRRGLRKTERTPPLPLCHVSPVVPQLRQRGVAYLNLLQQEDPPESVPYQTAIENSNVLKSHVENQESFAQQLENCRYKVRKLEEEKVHWMLEWQLLQAKFERQSKDTLHSGDGLHTADSGGDVRAIATHLKSRIKDLIQQMQRSDSKATYFYGECQALQRRLRAAEAARNAAETELRNQNSTFQTLKEETSLLTRNYEDQLSTMSEHLASMNEKLTQQKDEIDALRHSNKLGKKSK